MGFTTLVIFGAKYLIVVPFAAAAVYLQRAGIAVVRQFALRALIALPLSYIAGRIAGFFYAHEQPFAVYGYEPLVPHEIDNSFPSDHTSLSAALAGVAYFTNRALGLALLAFPFLIGASRIAAGLHYGEDVVVGVVIGLLCAGCAYGLEKSVVLLKK